MDHSGENNKLYDLATIYAISDNNPQFFNKLLLMFSLTIAKDMEDIKAAAAEKNWIFVGQLAHKVKPLAEHFGITSLKDLIKKLERQDGKDAEKLNEMITRLDATINNVLSGLKAEFPATFAG